MSTVVNFKGMIDLPEWRPLSPSQTTSAAGHTICTDLRNGSGGDPFIYKLTSLTTLEAYSPFNDEWFTPTAFTTLGGAIAAGAYAIFSPTGGQVFGTATALSTTSITLATLPNSSTVAINAFANRGDGVGYKVRVIDLGAGGTGKTNERFITSSTAGTTPVLTFDIPLDWVPASGARYELLSGAVYMFSSGTTAPGYFKKYDIATNSVSGNLSVTNLSATIGTDSFGVMLDEQYVPYDLYSGEGMIAGTFKYDTNYVGGGRRSIQATASAAGTITGSALPSSLNANEYSNFQIRIVEDLVNTTSVGQRLKIASHTSGASAVFTMTSNWVTQPSSSAKFVIENNNDLIFFTNGALFTYSYPAGGFLADASWSTLSSSGGATQYANPLSAMGAGCGGAMSWSIEPDISRNARHSFLYRFRGAATATLERLDIAANSWTAISPSFGQNATISTGTSHALDAAGNYGKYFYINPNGGQRFLRFDMLNITIEPWCFMRIAAGAALAGNKLCITPFTDGSTKIGMMYYLLSTSVGFYNNILIR